MFGQRRSPDRPGMGLWPPPRYHCIRLHKGGVCARHNGAVVCRVGSRARRPPPDDWRQISRVSGRERLCRETVGVYRENGSRRAEGVPNRAARASRRDADPGESDRCIGIPPNGSPPGRTFDRQAVSGAAPLPRRKCDWQISRRRRAEAGLTALRAPSGTN